MTVREPGAGGIDFAGGVFLCRAPDSSGRTRSQAGA